MSHSTVLIVGQDPEKLLKPYQELDMTPEDAKADPRSEFVDDTKDIQESFEKYKEEGETIEESCEADGYAILEDGRMGYYHNPNAKWDWYSLGGRWDGHLILKDGTTSNQAFKKDIDVKAMVQKGIDNAGTRYDKMLNVCKGHIPAYISWKTFSDKMSDDYTIEQVREDYRNQAGMTYVNDCLEEIRETNDTLRSEVTWYELGDFQCTRDEYIEKCKYNSFSTFAVLNDDKWFEKGEMGWFGMVSDENNNWEEDFIKIFDSINDDELISIYDLHI